MKMLLVRRGGGILQLSAADAGASHPPESSSAQHMHCTAFAPGMLCAGFSEGGTDACQVSPWAPFGSYPHSVKCRPQAKGAEPCILDPE